MKILMINVVCGIRSTGRICTDLADALTEQGHTVKIAYGREEVPEQYKKYAHKIGTDLDVKLHGIKARLLDESGFGSKKATVRFIEWVKKFDPDVIHLHNIHGYYINIEVLFNYLRTCGKKIIWTLHDCWAFTGHSAYCDAVNCSRWEKGCYNCPNVKEYPKSFMDRSKCNWLKKRKLFTKIPNLTIITPSKWLAKLVKKSFLKKYPVTVIHNGIDTSQFYPMKNDFREHYKIEDKFILLGVASSWNEMKGLSDYVQLARRLDNSYCVVLVGLNQNQIKDMPANMICIERTNSTKELAYIYSAADLLVNLSYCKSFGMTNVEAQLCGTPVITYATGGCVESAGKNGLIVEKGNLNEVIKQVVKYKTQHPEKSDLRIERSSFDKILTTNEYVKKYQGGYWHVKSEYGLIGKFVILGVAAIWDKRKGLDDIIKLSKQLDDTYQIIVVGVSEEQKSKLPHTILGFTRTNSVEELRRLYSMADVFINPTYEDNYPTTNLEAIACGTPVITYDTGGSGESAVRFGFSVKRGVINELHKMVIRHVKANKIENCTWCDYKITADSYVKIIIEGSM